MNHQLYLPFNHIDFGFSFWWQELMEDFLFPASKVVVQTRKNKAETPLDPVVPVCASSASINAAFELLVALCVNCVANMKLVVDTLREMYYSGMFTHICQGRWRLSYFSMCFSSTKGYLQPSKGILESIVPQKFQFGLGTEKWCWCFSPPLKLILSCMVYSSKIHPFLLTTSHSVLISAVINVWILLFLYVLLPVIPYTGVSICSFLF